MKLVYPRMPSHLDKRKKLSKEDISTIRKMHKSGMSHRKIGVAMGINRSTAAYWTGDKERQNTKAIEWHKKRGFSAERSKIQKRCYAYRQKVLGVEPVRKFQREYKKLKQPLYPDYRVSCSNAECPYLLTVHRKDGYSQPYRYSGRIHRVCPKCNQ